MIGVQKRKLTCVRANEQSNNSVVSNRMATSQQQTAAKSSRKRTKLIQPARSQSASTVVNQKLANGTGKGSPSKNYQCQHDQPPGPNSAVDGANVGQTSDESVWIFGLINNIEQLLSTFTAINTNPTSSCNNSGTSTPTSLSSSFSFSNSSSQSSSTTPSRSASASSSPSSANSPASIISSNSPSSSSFGAPLPPPAATLGSLPRSPISRQIKFHEYKGPPSAKRQQQPQSVTKSSQQQQPQKSTSNPAPESLVASKSCCKFTSSTKTSPTNQVSAASAEKHISPSNKLAGESKQLVAVRPATLGALRPLAAAQQQAQIQMVRLDAGCSLNQAPQQQTGARQVLNFQHQMACARSVPVQQQQQLRQVAAQNQLTSGAQGANLQTTFYIDQAPSTLETLAANGPTLLLAPTFAIGTNTKQHSSPVSVAAQQRPNHPHLAQASHLTHSQAAGANSSNGGGCGAGNNTRNQSCIGGSIFPFSATRMEPSQAGSQLLAQPPADSPANCCEPGLLALVDVKPTLGQLQECGNNYVQQQQQLELGSASQLDYDGLRDDLTTFGPDSEDTDACEIEPSVGFSHGVEELLFSEFIDLQDVPMNVDESDWLKKFLPPCSMG